MRILVCSLQKLVLWKFKHATHHRTHDSPYRSSSRITYQHSQLFTPQWKKSISDKSPIDLSLKCVRYRSNSRNTCLVLIRYPTKCHALCSFQVIGLLFTGWIVNIVPFHYFPHSQWLSATHTRIAYVLRVRNFLTSALCGAPIFSSSPWQLALL